MNKLTEELEKTKGLTKIVKQEEKVRIWYIIQFVNFTFTAGQ